MIFHPGVDDRLITNERFCTVARTPAWELLTLLFFEMHLNLSASWSYKIPCYSLIIGNDRTVLTIGKHSLFLK